MKLNLREQLVLAGVFRDGEYWAKQSWDGNGLRSTSQLGAYRIRIKDARQGLVPMNAGEWIGHTPTPSEAVMLHRAYKRLESAGLLERSNQSGYSDRTSHLRLSEAGEEMARQLANREAEERSPMMESA
ncbi:MAG: hypothetical protein ACKV2Q_20515 [Planctomycetaceae bacterium]